MERARTWKDENCFAVCAVCCLCFSVLGLLIWMIVLNVEVSNLEHPATTTTTLAPTTATTVAAPTPVPPATFEVGPMRGAKHSVSLRAALLDAKKQAQVQQQAVESSTSDDSWQRDVPILVSNSSDDDTVSTASESSADFVIDQPIVDSSSTVSSDPIVDPSVSSSISDSVSSSISDSVSDSSSGSSSDPVPSPTTTTKTTTKPPATTTTFNAKRDAGIQTARGTIRTGGGAAAAAAKQPVKPTSKAPQQQPPVKVLSMAERLRAQKAQKM